jgi:hypothetical protein
MSGWLDAIHIGYFRHKSSQIGERNTRTLVVATIYNTLYSKRSFCHTIAPLGIADCGQRKSDEVTAIPRVFQAGPATLLLTTPVKE